MLNLSCDGHKFKSYAVDGLNIARELNFTESDM